MGVAGEREGWCLFHAPLVERRAGEEVVAVGVGPGRSWWDLVVARVEKTILGENCKVQFLPKQKILTRGYHLVKYLNKQTGVVVGSKFLSRLKGTSIRGYWPIENFSINEFTV